MSDCSRIISRSSTVIVSPRPASPFLNRSPTGGNPVCEDVRPVDFTTNHLENRHE